MKKKIIEITYYRGHALINNFLRSCDLYQEGEGVFVQEKMTATVKKGTAIDEKWKKKFIKAWKEVNKKYDYEVTNFEFKLKV